MPCSCGLHALVSFEDQAGCTQGKEARCLQTSVWSHLVPVQTSSALTQIQMCALALQDNGGAIANLPCLHVVPTQALQDNGGAIALEAGGTFCMALTAQGRVVIWGKIGGPVDRRANRPEVAEIMGLPPIISIAAGQSHALMTDGERVWALGRFRLLHDCMYCMFAQVSAIAGSFAHLTSTRNCVAADSTACLARLCISL